MSKSNNESILFLAIMPISKVISLNVIATPCKPPLAVRVPLNAHPKGT